MDLESVARVVKEHCVVGNVVTAWDFLPIGRE